MNETPTGRGSVARSWVLYAILAVTVIMVIIQVVALLNQNKSGQVAAVAATATMRPTRTATPTMTPIPATDTPTATATPTDTPEPTATPTEPPTATPLPATETPIPPTAPPAPTSTPVPPTAVPATLLQQIPVSNGDLGSENIYIRYPDGAETSDMKVKGNDGHTYLIEIGFLSTAQAQARVQEVWNWASRGGGNWKMLVTMREAQGGWMCDGDDPVCYETDNNDGNQTLQAQMFIRDWAYRSLIDSYNAGGVMGCTSNQYYYTIQNKVLGQICDKCDGIPTDVPVMAFRFTRVD